MLIRRASVLHRHFAEIMVLEFIYDNIMKVVTYAVTYVLDVMPLSGQTHRIAILRPPATLRMRHVSCACAIKEDKYNLLIFERYFDVNKTVCTSGGI